MEAKRENWKRIENIDGEYMISNLGNMINVHTGKKVGTISPSGYVCFMGRQNEKRKLFRLHRFVWNAFGHHMPVGDEVIDHINNEKSDNRISNLQLLKFRDNAVKGIKLHSSDFHGVHWDKSKQRWRAVISLADKRYHLGYVKTIMEAKNLYIEALERFEKTGLTPNDVKEKIPEGKKKCTICKGIKDVSEFDVYKTSNGHMHLNPKCKLCYKEYRRVHDNKYRNK